MRAERLADHDVVFEAAGPIGLEELPDALATAGDGRARKWVVRPG